MEEMDQDSFYFLSKSQLLDRVDYRQKLNSDHQESSTERNFWCQVDQNLIELLPLPWAYGIDFQMFGYSVKQYLDSLHPTYQSCNSRSNKK